jgi:hypothetical protein
MLAGKLILSAKLVELLLGFSLIIQTLEYLKLLPWTVEGGIWDWRIQRFDIPPSAPLIAALLDFIFISANYKILLISRLLCGISLMTMGVNPVSAWFLLFTNLLLLIRWRGAFNGGSDFMTLVLTCGLTLGQSIGLFEGEAMGWVAALWYICIHSITSYFMSGWVKLLNGSWRRGVSLPIFLNTGVFGPLPANSIFNKPWFSSLCSWTFILWEAGMPLSLISFEIAMIFCAAAVVFHFLVFWFFGLNRFFWAWVTSLPAILYCSTWKW